VRDFSFIRNVGLSLRLHVITDYVNILVGIITFGILLSLRLQKQTD
jgi:hypothetical protein